MIHFITGKPRGGKGLWAIKQICKALLETENYIVTNLPLKMEELQEYVIDQGRPDIFVASRVVELTNDYLNCVVEDYKSSQRLNELRYFFLHRGPFIKLPLWEKGTEIEWDHYLKEDWWRSTTYVIDELHKVYPNRDYKLTEARILEYFAEHGHLGDTVYLVTQYIGQVDKKVQSGMVQDYTVCRNRRKEKVSLFRGPPLFTRHVYLTAPTGSRAHDVSVETGAFTLNKAEAACYSTTRQGGKADSEDKPRGISLAWIIPVVAIIVVLAFYAPTISTAAIKGVIGTDDHTELINEPAQQNDDANSQAKAPAKKEGSWTAKLVGSQDAQEEVEAPVFWESIGHMRIGDTHHIRIKLTDGRILTEQSQDLEKFHARKGIVVIDGVSYQKAPTSSDSPI